MGTKWIDLPMYEIAVRYEAGESLGQLAPVYRVSRTTIGRRLNAMGVTLRPKGGQRGSLRHHPGGPFHLDSRGYWISRDRVGKRSRVHRACWEAYRGLIPEGWVVHHVNGDRLDNRIENLLAMSNSKHSALHRTERRRDRRRSGEARRKKKATEKAAGARAKTQRLKKEAPKGITEMELSQAIVILMLGYSSLDSAAKETWLLLRTLQSAQVLITSGSLDRIAEIRGRHCETIRRHISALRENGLITQRRRSNLIVYSLVDPVATNGDFLDTTKSCAEISSHMHVYESTPPLPFRERGEESKSNHIGVVYGKALENWNAKDFLRLASDLYRKVYGHASLDLEQSAHGERRQGIVVSRIKRELLQRFGRIGLTKQDISDYIEWIFTEKSEALDINLGLLCSRSIQSEFLSVKAKKDQALKGKKQITSASVQVDCPLAAEAGQGDGDAWRFYGEENSDCVTCPRRMVCSEKQEREGK